MHFGLKIRYLVAKNFNKFLKINICASDCETVVDEGVLVMYVTGMDTAAFMLEIAHKVEFL